MSTVQTRAAGTARASRLLPGSARATLLNVIGDLVFPDEMRIPTAVFVAMMGKLGYTEHAARQAISRCAAAGWISGEKRGRVTSWSLTALGNTLVSEGLAGVAQLADEHQEWDNRWLLLMISIPQQQRAVRDAMYRALRWDGFGNPAPAIWVSPHPGRRRRTDAALKRLSLQDATFSFAGSPDSLGMSQADLVAKAWDMERLTTLYDDLVRRFEGIEPRSDEEHAIALLQLDQELQQLLVTDPQLPSALLPHWKGREDAARLLELRSTWHPAADRYWSEIVTTHA